MTDLKHDAELSRFDPADYLTSEQAMEEYLTAALDAGDPSAIAAALGDVARARNFSRLARDVGMSREGLRRALSGEGNPTLETVMKVSRALGLKMAFHAARITSEQDKDT